MLDLINNFAEDNKKLCSVVFKNGDEFKAKLDNITQKSIPCDGIAKAAVEFEFLAETGGKITLLSFGGDQLAGHIKEIVSACGLKEMPKSLMQLCGQRVGLIAGEPRPYKDGKGSYSTIKAIFKLENEAGF